MAEMLRLDDVVAGYGSASVLHGVSLAVDEGELAVILGANGAGKTTTLRAVVGLIRPWSGAITFDGQLLGRTAAEHLVRERMGIVPEPPAVFRDMPVLENLRVGGFALGRNRADVEQRIEELFGSFPRLRERSRQLAGSLSGGEQRLLAVARALMGRPRLLLVDEVSMGLSPTAVADVFRLMGRLRDEGVTVCMVEQNVSALEVADRAYVMEKGRIVHEERGDLSTVRAEVTKAYLGGTRAEAGAR